MVFFFGLAATVLYIVSVATFTYAITNAYGTETFSDYVIDSIVYFALALILTLVAYLFHG